MHTQMSLLAETSGRRNICAEAFRGSVSTDMGSGDVIQKPTAGLPRGRVERKN